MKHIVAISVEEFEKHKAPLRFRQHLASLTDDNDEVYCNIAASDVISIEFKDKNYEITLADLFDAVEKIHNPESPEQISSVSGGVSVTELSPREDE